MHWLQHNTVPTLAIDCTIPRNTAGRKPPVSRDLCWIKLSTCLAWRQRWYKQHMLCHWSPVVPLPFEPTVSFDFSSQTFPGRHHHRAHVGMGPKFITPPLVSRPHGVVPPWPPPGCLSIASTTKMESLSMAHPSYSWAPAVVCTSFWRASCASFRASSSRSCSNKAWENPTWKLVQPVEPHLFGNLGLGSWDMET